ncbi:TPA: glycerol dehydrogenase [Streptococcus pneumoniae]|uniref:glycerol dehydrogenase n=1 Tax=Streptococcus pneumoniae TaxID=1313 RepID=UPI002DCC5C2B|nr:glycerol dehydrogenase [Streptococcus pneumoniae]HEU2372921.1 glycerol dehydrogenase [Streptococcus pneumoniae]HEU2407048.1 glycerol dehydrogenase [Streptococcus pneumoniae]HEU2822848.1 glycerol dehydrogenase [Streptococcus pneumoniae]HEV3996389.1 glycerol dehydrogenase [Streptococcus pneumoniae]
MRIFASPSRYIQGENALFENAKSILDLGNYPILLCDQLVYDIVGKRFEDYLHRYGFHIVLALFNGEASDNEINRVVALAEKENCDSIIGLGGGKTIDSAKAIADLIEKPVIIAPTIASTDAPVSALSVIYTDEGAFDHYLFYSKNPDLVLVDTKVISQAPKRLLASGIADGLQAMAACEAKVVTPALENIVEANTLLSGLGFESGGLAAAHAIHNGFTALTGDIHHLTHGEKVAYGTLVQLLLENRPKEELDKYIEFYKKIGMPTTLKEMHLDQVGYDDLIKVGKQATMEGETIHQMPFKISPSDVAQAIIAVDAYVNSK